MSNLTKFFDACALMTMKEYDSALLLFSKIVPGKDYGTHVRSVIYLRKGEYDKGLALRRSVGADQGFTYLLLQYLNNEWMDKAALKRAIRSQPSDINSGGESSIQLFNAMGDQEAADSVAHVIDSRLLGSSGLATNVLIYGLHFHLKAAPNFTKRLIELGIDPQKFEEENFQVLEKKKIGTGNL